MYADAAIINKLKEHTLTINCSVFFISESILSFKLDFIPFCYAGDVFSS
jgi:hypothetical protein